MDTNNKEVKNPHKGHRKRLRDKALKNGIDSLAEHEVMELILFFSIAQKNTNSVAHRLIDEFGSVSAVLDAPETELVKIEGVSQTTASILKSVPEIASYYMQDKLKNNITDISSSEDAYEILAPKYIGKTAERVMALFLNSAGKTLACEEISEGTVNSAGISSRKIVELCIKYQATQVILSHNHPSGNPMPSMDDFIASKNVNSALKSIDSKLVDHLIITDRGFTSMERLNQFKNAFK